MSLCICLIYAHMCPYVYVPYMSLFICPIYAFVNFGNTLQVSVCLYVPMYMSHICPYVYVSYMPIYVPMYMSHICPYLYVQICLCQSRQHAPSVCVSICPMCMSHICPIYLECAPLVWSITHSLTDCGICPYMSLYVPTCPYMCSLETHSLTVAYAPLRPYMSLYVPICPYMCGH